MNPEHGVAEIIKRYKFYCARIFESWEDYSFQNHYLPLIHKKIKDDSLDVMEYEHHYTGAKRPFRKKELYGVISRQKDKTLGERTLLAMVSYTEDYLQAIAYRIYRDLPYKLQSKSETPEQQGKLLKIIVESDDKEEMISKISEEKIRGIFYGNPIDFFKKDKAKIGIGTIINDNYIMALTEYAEIIARRNICTHNHGKVDRKYFREIKGSTFKVGQKLSIGKEYLEKAFIILHGLASVTTELVIQNTYQKTITKDSLNRFIQDFNTKYKGK